MLEKWQCHECEKGWLLIQADTIGKEVKCPFCGTSGKHVMAVARQADDDLYEEEMGCLWPGYNEYDKMAWEYMNRQPGKDAEG